MPAYNPETRIGRGSNSAEVSEAYPPGDGSEDDGGGAIAALHKLCGVYTKPPLVRRVLDRVGWTVDADLAEARLLEPAAGAGAFVVEAAARLVLALRRGGLDPTIKHLRERILAFELVPEEAGRARLAVRRALCELGVHHTTAYAAARAWVKTGDFLLADLPHASFTHVAGNPPYVRWAKVPEALRLAYSARLSASAAKGDLLLPFLDRSFSMLAPGGHCGLVCSDRWRYAAYAQAFRAEWLPRLNVATEPTSKPSEAFSRDVYVYPDLLVVSLRASSEQHRKPERRRGETLQELGCSVRVGPALGVTSAFVVPTGETPVELKLLHPWVDTAEVVEGAVRSRGRQVISTWGEQGLADLACHPRLRTHLAQFRDSLTQRYIVRQGAPWYRTIDRIVPVDWAAPKLLVPELAKVPRLAVDRSGAIPSHGIYCIFSPEREIEEIYERLRNGRLAKALAPIAPKVKGSYTRCYGRFLKQMRI